MGKDESLTPLFSRGEAYGQIMDQRNMIINSKTKVPPRQELRTRTTLAFTIPLRGSSATNFLHNNRIYDLEMLQLYLKFVENVFYVDRHATRELKSVGLKPLRRGSRAPGSMVPPRPRAKETIAEAANRERAFKKSLKAFDQSTAPKPTTQSALDRLLGSMSDDDDEGEDEDMEGDGPSLRQSTGGSFEDECFNASLEDFENKDPREGIRATESTSQFHYEVVFVDENSKLRKKKANVGEHRTGYTEAEVIELVRSWIDDIPSVDREAQVMCMKSFEEFVANATPGEKAEAGEKRMANIVPDENEVDCITLFAHIASRHDVNQIFEMMLSENRVAQGASGEHCLMRQLRGIVEDQIMGLDDEEDGSDEEDDEDAYAKKKRKTDKKKNPNAPPTQKAPDGDKLGVHSTHVSFGRWCKIVAGYTGNSLPYDEYLNNSRQLENFSTSILAPEVVFSVHHALRKRSRDCNKVQSLIAYRASKKPNYRGPIVYDSDKRYDADGLRTFAYPVPVIRLPPSEVTNARILPLTFPHIQESRVHPLISGASELFESELSKISAVGVCENFDPKFRRKTTTTEQGESDSDSDDGFDEYEEALMEDCMEMYSEFGIHVAADEISPVKNGFDQDILKSDVPFDMRMARATQVLTTCAASTVDTAIRVAHTCTQLIRGKLIGEKRIVGTKRRRCIRLINSRWVARFIEVMRGHQFPNSSATRAVYEAIDKGLYDKVPMSFRRVADDISPIGNFMAATTIACSEILFAAEPHLLMTLEVLSLNAADRESYCHTHCLVVGSGAKSKSWNLDRVEAMHIAPSENNSTVFQHTDSSKMAHRVGGFEMDGSLFIKHEVNRSMLISPDEGGSGDQWWKDVTEKCKSVYQVFEVDKLTGARTSRKVVDTLRIVYEGACNFSLEGVEASVLQRFFVMYASNKHHEMNNVSTKMVESTFCSMLRDEDQNEETLNFTMQQIQAVIFEIEVLIAAGALERVNENIGYLIISYVSNYLETKGVNGFNARLLRFYVKVARTLCLIDWVVAEYMIPGGRFYGQKISYSHFLSCDSALVITSAHMVLAIGLLAPYSFVQGEGEVRQALRADIADRNEGYRVAHKKQIRIDMNTQKTAPMQKDMAEMVAKICPKLSYQSHDSSSFKPRNHMPPPVPQQQQGAGGGKATFKGILDSNSGAGETPAKTVNVESNGMYGDDEYGFDGDVNDYDLDYCVFNVVTREAFTQEVHQRMMCMKDMDCTPPENAIRKVLFDQMHKMMHTDVPMELGTTLEEPLVRSKTAAAKEFPVAKWCSVNTLAIHYGWLQSTCDDMTHMEDALKSLFNTKLEPPRRYLYRPHIGAAYHTIILGQGYAPGSVKKSDRDMAVHPKTGKPISNPSAFRVMTMPNMFKRATIANVMYNNLGESSYDDWEDTLNANENQVKNSWREVDMLYMRESFDQMAHLLRRQDIDWCEEPISEEDLRVAAECFADWCRGDYSNEEDIRRFGAVEKGPNGTLRLQQQQHKTDDLTTTHKGSEDPSFALEESMGVVVIDYGANAESSGGGGGPSSSGGGDQSLSSSFDSVDYEDPELDDKSNYWTKSYTVDDSDAVGKDSSSRKGKDPVHDMMEEDDLGTISQSDSYFSVLDFSLTGFEDENTGDGASAPSSQESGPEVPMPDGSMLSLRAYRDKVKEGNERVLLTIEDLRPDIDFDPSQYMVPNKWFRHTEPEHPLTNARMVPGWVFLPFDRAYYKTKFLGSEPEKLYRMGQNDPLPPTGNYPYDIIKNTKRQHEVRKSARGAATETGQHTMAPLSNCTGYRPQDSQYKMAEDAVHILSDIRKEQKKKGRKPALLGKRTRNEILRQERSRSIGGEGRGSAVAASSVGYVEPPRKKKKKKSRTPPPVPRR